MSTFTATRIQVATYLLGVCPFSIAFLVFLNSSVSFVITDLIGRENGVGDAVGNLGFADELVAIVACPIWGLLSDRIGVRTVCVIGYAIICLALILFVQAKNVYPQLLLGRLFFSVGAAAASTMVTAVLPTMSYVEDQSGKDHLTRPVASGNGRAHAPSIASELTITQARFQSSSNQSASDPLRSSTALQTASTSKVAGFVGMFTGLGALLALFVFLPLPASFQRHGTQPGRALQYSYYIVAATALTLSLVCLLGLRGLKSEHEKSWSHLLGSSVEHQQRTSPRQKVVAVAGMLKNAVQAGYYHSDIGIGYVGGFVARASSVAISLFIPLLVNAMFTSSGLCDPIAAPGGAVITADTPAGLPDIKRRCPRAYIVAAELTGASQMVALVAAPIFGYWSARTARKSLPLTVAAVAGIIGYPLFATQFDPHDSNKGARAVAFVAVAFIGLSQIGAIVCSLASLGAGVLVSGTGAAAKKNKSAPALRVVQDAASAEAAATREIESAQQADESDALLSSVTEDSGLSTSSDSRSLADIKGSVAGVYSFFGGMAILILTKAGGALFDSVSFGAPFYIMACFNAVLLVVNVGTGLFTSSAIRGI